MTTISDRLAHYAALIRRFAPTVDLISPGDIDRLEERHLEDSLRALPFVAGAGPGPAVDVGSGAGLPGIPLAISDPGRQWRLLEPRRRRAAFLEEAVRELDLANVEVVADTAAGAAARFGPTHAVAVARAVAPPARALALLRPLVVPRGTLLLFVGSSENAMKDAEVAPGLVMVVAEDDIPMEESGDEHEQD